MLLCRILQLPMLVQDLDDEPVTEADLAMWRSYGSLPAWLTGRSGVRKIEAPLNIVDAIIDELAQCEKKWCDEASSWRPPAVTPPKPLSESHLYFLVFFSGHRRYGDLVSWIEWTCEGVTPLPIDLAIDSFLGRCSSWRALGGFNPRWESGRRPLWAALRDLRLANVFPRPLRTLDYGWGLPCLFIREMKQLDVGSILMWISLGYMTLISAYGGSATLEHPKGQAPALGRFSVWVSSLVKRLVLSPEWDIVTFLQGALGVEYAKPTRCGYLDWRRLLYSAYTPGWRPTEVLGGRTADGAWATMKAKAYPLKMNQVLCYEHWRYIQKRERHGHAEDSPALKGSLSSPFGLLGIPICIPPRESWWPATIMASFGITVYRPIVQISSITRQNGFWVVLASRQLRLQTQWKENCQLGDYMVPTLREPGNSIDVCVVSVWVPLV